MTQPRSSSAYPLPMFAAIDAALSRGEFLIPCEKPSALRLRFQGLRGALRRENLAEKIDSVSFHLAPTGLLIRHKDNSADMQAIEAALDLALSTPQPEPSESAQAAASLALSRILGEPNA